MNTYHSSLLKKWFKDNGWYTEQEMNVSETLFNISGVYSLKASRNNIKNNYSFIALHLMTKSAIENGVNFDKAIFNGDYRVYDDIFLGSLLDSFSGSKLDLSFLTPFQLRQFRYEYLHWSSRINETGLGPRIDDNSPNYPKFKRKRIPG